MIDAPKAPALSPSQTQVTRTTPLPAWPHVGTQEIEAATSVLASGRVNYWTGTEGRQFEAEYAEYLGVNHAIAVTNGTAALELALYALDIGPGDEVVTTSRTFVASASAIVMRGATPVIADVDRESQNMTAETIERVLTPNTKAIIVVHLAGWPCDMDPILELARERGIKVIEDCAQAHGATYKGRQVGSLGDVSAFSFCQDKILTTGGEGGLVAMNDEDLYKRAWAFKDHGKDYDLVHEPQTDSGYRWLVKSFGTNLRMTEMQAAIGRVILQKLDGWVETRRRNASILDENIAGLPGLRLTRPPKDVGHAYYKYYVFVEPSELRPGWDRDRIQAEINALGIPCQSGSCSEIYLEEAFQANGWGPAGRLPVAKELGETSLMFMVHPTLSEADMVDTARAITRVMFQAAQV